MDRIVTDQQAGPAWLLGASLPERVCALALGADGHPGRGADILAPMLATVLPAEWPAVATDLLELLVAADRLDEADELAARGANAAALLLARGDAVAAAAEAERGARPRSSVSSPAACRTAKLPSASC